MRQPSRALFSRPEGEIGLERLRIGRLGVTWDSASDSAARRIDREVRHKVESGRGGGHDVERSNEQWLLEMVARDGQGVPPPPSVRR